MSDLAKTLCDDQHVLHRVNACVGAKPPSSETALLEPTVKTNK